MKMIEIDGKSYVLKFTFNDVIKFEDLSGKSIIELEDNISFKNLRLLVHIAFESGGSKHDVERTGDLIQAYGVQETFEIVGQLMTEFMGNLKSTENLKKVTG